MNNNFKNTLYNNNLIRDTQKYVLDDEEHNQLINEIDYSKLSKGDLKKLQSQGKIKSIYFPYN